jgi:hypothetical protein
MAGNKRFTVPRYAEKIDLLIPFPKAKLTYSGIAV